MFDRRWILGLTLIALVGCRKAEEQTTTEQPDSAKPEPAAPETPEQGCARMLARFGEDVAESESDACVEALTTGTELALCREAGVEADYLTCFDSCMGSVDIDPSEYDPADSSSSPVVNCTAGCNATTCQ